MSQCSFTCRPKFAQLDSNWFYTGHVCYDVSGCGVCFGNARNYWKCNLNWMNVVEDIPLLTIRQLQTYNRLASVCMRQTSWNQSATRPGSFCFCLHNRPKSDTYKALRIKHTSTGFCYLWYTYVYVRKVRENPLFFAVRSFCCRSALLTPHEFLARLVVCECYARKTLYNSSPVPRGFSKGYQVVYRCLTVQWDKISHHEVCLPQTRFGVVWCEMQI